MKVEEVVFSLVYVWLTSTEMDLIVEFCVCLGVLEELFFLVC